MELKKITSGTKRINLFQSLIGFKINWNPTYRFDLEKINRFNP
ncbi:hypothetical protein BFG60_1978 [Microcystis aeruginosa NIES-98]|nr:hypothetical protein BFG60_1978 [Microcystis aeruginosa NIES-98]